VEFKGLLFYAQVLIKSTDDLNERTHNEREESNTRKHNAYANNLFKVGYWEEVSVAHC
jgi:hypothetical protein